MRQLSGCKAIAILLVYIALLAGVVYGFLYMPKVHKVSCQSAKSNVAILIGDTVLAGASQDSHAMIYGKEAAKIILFQPECFPPSLIQQAVQIQAS